MAKAVVPVADGEAAAPAKGPSMIVQIIVLLVMTGVAAGAGLGVGKHLVASAPKHEEPKAAHGAEAGKKDDKAADPAEADLKRGIVPVPPITTNLSGTGETWVRMEVSAVFEKEPDPAMADIIHQDLLAFLRTVKLHQVEGASGFRHLKADMEDRARIRSDGRVASLMIKTLLFE